MNTDTSSGSRGLRPARRANLAAQAYEAIVEAIFDRQLLPGTRLSIDGLAGQLDMSTTPVREALSHVLGQRLVLQESNRGFTVAPLLTEEEFHDLFGVRRLLESHAVGTGVFDKGAIERVTEISSLMPTMEHGPVYRDFREFNRADREFHRTLVAASRNAVLLRSWEDLHFHLHVGRLYAGVGVIDFGDAIREHSEIVAALGEGNGRHAAVTATRHTERAEERLRRLIPTF